MSTFSRVTRHPQTGEYEKARWIDDYYGRHLYGVEFPSDKKVYPPEMVNKAQLPELWTEDVIKGMYQFAEEQHPNLDPLTVSVSMMGYIQNQYKARWERDSTGGEGAVDYYVSKFKETNTSKRIDDERSARIQDKPKKREQRSIPPSSDPFSGR